MTRGSILLSLSAAVADSCSLTVTVWLHFKEKRLNETLAFDFSPNRNRW